MLLVWLVKVCSVLQREKRRFGATPVVAQLGGTICRSAVTLVNKVAHQSLE